MSEFSLNHRLFGGERYIFAKAHTGVEEVGGVLVAEEDVAVE